MREYKLHIVMLNKAYPPDIGGIERHTRDISEALSQRGWRVTVLACNDGNYKTCETNNSVTVIRVPSYGRLFSLPLSPSYYRALRLLKPDLVHAHVPFPLAWRAVCKLPETIPVVCTWHSDIVRQTVFKPLYNGLEQRFIRRCDKILPTSSVLRDSSSALRQHHEKCKIIPLALPEQKDSDEAWLNNQAEAFKQSFDKPVILFVGRLVGYKGLPYLIKAMKNVDAMLLIAGEGREHKTLQHLVDKNDLKNRVELLGSVNEAEKQVLYRAADVFVLPSISRNEAFGYVLLEAMSSGCPVISTDLPTGVKVVNQHQETGLVVPPKNSEALSNAINTLLRNDEIRLRYARNARARVQQYYSFDLILSEIEKVYREQLNKPGNHSVS